MKKKLLLLGLLPILGIGAGSSFDVKAFDGRYESSFYGDVGSDRTAYCQKAMKLNSEIADEGVVLLKNLDGFLPLNKGATISVTGKSSTSLVRGGAGSGSGSVSSGITEVKMDGSLKDAGFETNQKFVDFYGDKNKSGSGRTNGNTGWKGISQVTIGETPLASYPDDVLDSLDDSDAAILVISREGSEGCDVKTCDCRDSNSDPISDRHALELSKNEEDLYNELKNRGVPIIVVVNSGNVFECDVFEQDDDVKAVLWMGTPGANGAGAIGRILAGDVNPSGKAVDTWARDFTLDPTFQNFSDNAQTNPVYDGSGNVTKYAPADTMFNADGSPVRSDGTFKGEPTWEDEENHVVNYGLNGVRPSSFLNYEEGIYVDYRYYETVYADIAKESGKDAADTWYEGEYGVVYPFGHGLSYTTFEQKIKSCDVAWQTVTNKDTHVRMKVEVENTGDVAGKDAVQVYFKAPYTAGGIEKAYNSLCGIGKTGLLQPGEKEIVDVDFYLQDVANYDFSDANKNGFCGYELDAGDYQISLNKSAHEEYDVVDFKIAENFQYETDRYTGNKVENRFTDAGFYSSLPGENDIEFTQFHRNDRENTFPTHPTLESRTLKSGSRVEEFYTHRFTMDDVEVSTDFEYIPQAVYKTKADIEALGWTQNNGTKLAASARTVKITDLIGSKLDDPRWDTLLNEFTWDEMDQFVDGGSHNPAVSEIGKLDSGDSDGPSKYLIMWWCGGPIVAATFNQELALKQGECVGEESHIQNGSTYGWAGPGVNIHRSPFGGRNFEYYSADPFITGAIAGRVVAGATNKGLYCFYKHFAVNDQEKHREGVSAFLTEQALREIYLKPFQMCIQEGKSAGIMSSYNRLGLMETAASYQLLTEVLREEWGFKGSIISDMTHHGNSAFDAGMYENINNRILAGCNNQLDGDDYTNDMNCKWDKTANGGKGAPVYKSTKTGQNVESYSWWYAVRTMCKECLWMNANSGVYAKTLLGDAGINFSDNVKAGMITVNKDQDFEITCEFPVDFSGAISLEVYPESQIDPEELGLSINGDKIVGNVSESGSWFVRVIIDNGSEQRASYFELIVLATAQAHMEPIEKPVDNPEKPEKKGCGGSVIAASALLSSISLLGLALIGLKRKED